MTAVLVSSNWDQQHYASDEIALSVHLYRQGRQSVVPVWLDDVPFEAYGLFNFPGIKLAEVGTLQAVADQLVAVVERARRRHNKETASHTTPGPTFDSTDKSTYHKLQVLEEFGRAIDIDKDIMRKAQEAILINWIGREGRIDRHEMGY